LKIVEQRSKAAREENGKGNVKKKAEKKREKKGKVMKGEGELGGSDVMELGKKTLDETVGKDLEVDEDVGPAEGPTIRQIDPGQTGVADAGSETNKKRKRHEKRSQDSTVKDQEPFEDSDAPTEPLSPSLAHPPSPEDELKFDQTLLAVIGILNTLKLESNVAGWIRSGKLWASGAAPIKTAGESNAQDEHRVKKQKIGGEMGANDGEGDAPMWFTHTPTMDHWAKKGREALIDLGLAVTDGIDR
jgi:hypothetical protein